MAEPDPQLLDTIRSTATKYGLDPETMVGAAGIESNFNPRAANPGSSARGLFQQMTAPGGSWQEYGKGADVFDPQANADATARQWVDNQKHFKTTLGRDPTPGEMYLMHQQGRAGGTALLQNPDVPVLQVLSRFYKDPSVAMKALTLNGGNPNMTAGQFANMWTGRMEQQMGGARAAPAAVAQAPAAGAGGAPAPAAFGALSPDQANQAAAAQQQKLQAYMQQIHESTKAPEVQPFTPATPISVIRGKMARAAAAAAGGGGTT